MISTGHALAFGTWFTFDSGGAGGNEKQRWYTFRGPAVSGAASATTQIYENVSGNFNAGPVTASPVVGGATLSFTACDRGQLT